MKNMIYRVGVLISILLISGCGEIDKIFKKESPHQRYKNMLEDTGLAAYELGRGWINKAESVLNDTLTVEIPYREKGYFPADEPAAFSYRFNAQRGERINISVDQDSLNRAAIFIDLYKTGQELDHASFAEDSSIDYLVEESGIYILRLQPELLKSGNYELNITRTPSLAFPVEGLDTEGILSFWGDERDGGKRKHEGVDIFAGRGTPALAAADGIILRTGTNRLGGNVVWLHTLNNQNLYYAHLDSQLVSAGQIVKRGDTLGLIGNTGNAITTPPHLHFGIYIPGEGAIDPFPFINNLIKKHDDITADSSLLGTWAKIKSRSAPMVINGQRINLSSGTPLKVNSAVQNKYRVSLPDGRNGFIESIHVQEITAGRILRSVGPEKEVYDAPDSTSAVVTILDERKGVLASYQNYSVIKIDDKLGWVKQ
jgi:peptidoglycan LD-endopeptidase LytH